MLRQKFFCIKANYRKDKLPNFSRNNVIYKVNCQNTYGAVCYYSVPFRVHDFNELFFFYSSVIPDITSTLLDFGSEC